MHFLQIIDESLSGKTLATTQIAAKNQIKTVQDLIEARIWDEVTRYNNAATEHFVGLVQPSQTEQLLNKPSKKEKRHTIDAEKQVYIALEAFQQNRFFILIDDVQAESLEQEIELKPDAKIAFVKLTPLIGG